MSTKPNPHGSVRSTDELHAWDVSPKEAVQIQRTLAPMVSLEGDPSKLNRIAGCDVSVRGDRVRAAIVVWDLASHDVLETAVHEDEVAFPYVPGLLSFREMPALIPAMEKLGNRPDVLMMDAQGYAHPRRLGLACHAGLWFDLPAFGVGKSRLTGTHEDPAEEKGSRSPLMDRDELIGWVVRTRDRVNPVFVSPGHRIDFEGAVQLTLQSALKYKLPEPTRLAHLLSKNGRL